MESLIDRFIVLGVVLGYWGVGYIVRLFGGIKNVRKKMRRWNWSQFFDGLLDRFCWLVAIGGAVAGCEMFKWLAPLLGITLSPEITLVLDTGSVIAIPFMRGTVDLIMGIKSIQASTGWENNVRSLEAGFSGEVDYARIAEAAKKAAKEIADLITPKHTTDDQQTSDDPDATPTAEELDEIKREQEEREAEGKGEGENPLSRIRPDGDNEEGKGWQCSKYSWYLATGRIMRPAKSADFGPVNGRDMVDYLIKTLGWVECGKIAGAIFSYNAGQWGHTGVVVDPKNNIVNDANWQPLTVSTHYLNLEAVGAVYCCPPAMLQPAASRPELAPATQTPVSKPDSTNKEEPKSAPGNNRTRIAEFKVGDKVVPIKKLDYDGRALRQYDPNYTITQIHGDRAVLSVRGQVWAAMNVANIKKA